MIDDWWLMIDDWWFPFSFSKWFQIWLCLECFWVFWVDDWFFFIPAFHQFLHVFHTISVCRQWVYLFTSYFPRILTPTFQRIHPCGSKLVQYGNLSFHKNLMVVITHSFNETWTCKYTKIKETSQLYPKQHQTLDHINT